MTKKTNENAEKMPRLKICSNDITGKDNGSTK